MRQVHLSDLHFAGGLLAGLPADAQNDTVQKALYQAHCADKYRKRLRRYHPAMGDGTLKSALALQIGARPVGYMHQDYLRAMQLVLTTLLAQSRG